MSKEMKYRVYDTLRVLNKRYFYYSLSTLAEAGVVQSEQCLCVCVQVCVCGCGPGLNLSGFIHVRLAVSGKEVSELPGVGLWEDIWVEGE